MTLSVSQSSAPIFSAFHGDEDFQELLVDFCTAARERSALLTESLAGQRLDAIRVTAHQLKGAGGGYGFDELSEHAAALEQACKQAVPSLDEIGPLLNVVVDYLDRVTC